MSDWELRGSGTIGENKNELGVRPCVTGRGQTERCDN